MFTDELKQADKEQMLALYEISQIINSILDPEELLNRVMDLVITTTKAERGFLMLMEPPGGELKVKVARNLDQKTIDNPDEISHTILREALESGQPVLTTDAKTDPRFEGSESVILYNIRSILCVPLNKQEKPIGLLYVDCRTTANIFSERDKTFLAAFSNLAAISIENARLQAKLLMENISLKQEIRHQFQFENIVGQAPKFQAALSLVEKVLESNVSVLIQGDSGTGKELIAKAVHYNGPRRDKQFVAQYCGALPESLLESELFGYRKGAFTGATANKPGLFEVADQGTFFLDEIADISPAIQAKLLRILQDGEMRRIGETKAINVDVRIISATNRDLFQEVKEGRFREDLFYRLNVVTINLPPLRDRREDIPLLVHHFLGRFPLAASKRITDIQREVMDLLCRYNWPGNIRELENVVSYAVVMCKGEVIRTPDLPQELLTQNQGGFSMTPGKTMREMEREYILSTLKTCDGDRKLTAKQLNISLRTLQYKLKEYRTE